MTRKELMLMLIDLQSSRANATDARALLVGFRDRSDLELELLLDGLTHPVHSQGLALIDRANKIRKNR